jgi:hypothetical protein
LVDLVEVFRNTREDLALAIERSIMILVGCLKLA